MAGQRDLSGLAGVLTGTTPSPWLLHPSCFPAPSPQPSYLFLYNSSFRASRSLVKSLLCCKHRKARSDTSRGEVRQADY